MNGTKNLFCLSITIIQIWTIITHERMRIFTLFHKYILIISVLLFSTTNSNAQKGLFVKFSLGPGYTTEFSNINTSGLAIASKNHTIGWGFTDKFALQIGEFGSLNKIKSNNYQYVNLDAFGFGFVYRTPIDLKVSVLGAYSKASFPDKWWEAKGADGGNGFGFNISIDKEWFIAKRWGIGIGPQVFWLKTTETDYQFFNVSLNGSIVFYLTHVK